jgi:hypothetical protein
VVVIEAPDRSHAVRHLITEEPAYALLLVFVARCQNNEVSMAGPMTFGFI